MEILNDIIFIVDNRFVIINNPFFRKVGKLIEIPNSIFINPIILLGRREISREKRILIQNKIKITIKIILKIMLICFCESGYTFILLLLLPVSL
jgi:hypothetical protein